MVYKIPPGGGGKPYPASGLSVLCGLVTQNQLIPVNNFIFNIECKNLSSELNQIKPETRATVDGTPSQIPAFLPLTFTLGQGHTNCCPVPSTSCHLCTCKVWSCNVWRLRSRCISRKYIIWPWPWVQGHMKCCPVPSKLCDLYTCKVWRCYVQGLRRRCNYKKIHVFTFDLDLWVKVTGNVAQ